MSRIKELKQNPDNNINMVDVFQIFCPEGKSKYIEFLIRLSKNTKHLDMYVNEVRENLKREFGITDDHFKGMTPFQIFSSYRFLEQSFNFSDLKTFQKFCDYNERGLIQDNDLSKFKSFDDVMTATSLAEIKAFEKDLEKQIHTLFTSDEWIVLRPLTFYASKKYGSSTKWCTASKDSPDYYFRYSRRGILIYCINKKTGNKVGAFKNLDTGYDVETSFWNITDQRIDSMESGLPNDILDVIRYDFFNTKESNWDILSDEERNRQLLWFENEYRMKKVSNDYDGPVAEEATPMNEVVPIRNIRRRLTPLRRVTIDAEAELTRLLEEEIMEESVRDMSEYSDDDYIDQAG